MDAKHELKKNLEKYIAKNGGINISKFAKDCKLSRSSVYHALYSDRNVNADIWFKIMHGFGAVKLSNKGIVIDTAI